MQLNPYLNFNGNCREAFKFYEETLGGRIVMMQTHGETPAKDYVPADWQDKIVHVRMEVGKDVLMGSDAPADRYAPTQGMWVSINAPSVADGQRLFMALSANGAVTMPFGETFWSAGFGMTVDRFGTPWMVNCEGAAA